MTKENEILQEEVENEVKNQSDLIIKNQELEKENEQLRKENQKLQQEVKATEDVIMEIADNLYQNQFPSLDVNSVKE